MNDKAEKDNPGHKLDTNHPPAPDVKPEPPPQGYARQGNYEQPRSFEGGEHDPSPAPDPGFDPKYGNNPYKGGFHRDRQGNERDKDPVNVKGPVVKDSD